MQYCDQLLVFLIHNNQQDCNDNPPVFTGTYTATIYELASLTPIGTQLFTVMTTDNDIGLNADHQYHLEPHAGSGLFEIDENTGIVRTAAVPDYEVHQTNIVFDVSCSPSTYTL